MSVARGAPPCARLHFRPSPQGEQMGGYRFSDTARPATGSVPSTHGSPPGQPPRLDDTSRQLSAHPPRAPPRRHCATDTPHLRRWPAPPLAATRRSVGTWGRSRRQRPLVIHPPPIGWTSGGRTAATGGRGLSPTRVWLPRRRGLGGGVGGSAICHRAGSADLQQAGRGGGGCGARRVAGLGSGGRTAGGRSTPSAYAGAVGRASAAAATGLSPTTKAGRRRTTPHHWPVV